MVTKEDVQIWFNNEVELSDELFNELLAKNKSLLELMIGTKVEPTDTTEYFDIETPTDHVYLSFGPVLFINGVYLNTNDEFNPVWEATFDWYYDEKTHRLIFNQELKPMRKLVKVDYQYGLINNSVADLLLTKLIIKDVLSIMLNRKSYDDEGDVSLGTLKISNSFKYSLSKIEQLNKDIDFLRGQLIGFRSYFK